jgi:putative endonuclease
MKDYFVYVLRCFDGTFYVGITNDVARRFAQHCAGEYKSCYAYKRRPLRLVHVSEFHWVDQAIAFEKKLKGWFHRKKRAFIEAKWSDLNRYARGPDRVLER